ncbi:hypothetical protein [Longibaculum muris]|uniref:hypothetical protein n=1 Tax=Longibaculum muris TaxID=1796628 RepID=UPI0022E35E40|nr:hypothetical protein [Longibaculum muris]
MNKKKIRMFGIMVLIISLILPIGISKLLDLKEINKEISLEDNQTQEILKKHPIIVNLYRHQQDYTADAKSETYVVKRKDEYSDTKQKQLLYLQSLFSNEIQKLIDFKILSRQLLEVNNDKKYQVEYGTIREYQNTYDLEHIFRMKPDPYKGVDYSMDADTHKITHIELRQENPFNYTDDEFKEIALQMIKYLELDDIDDWVYNQYGYESNQAKLRVSCYVDKRYTDTYNLVIEVTLLGVINSRLWGLYFDK